MSTTGDPTTDVVLLFGVVALLLGLLVVLAWPVEHTERGGRWADRLLVWLFGETPCCLGRTCDRCRGIVR